MTGRTWWRRATAAATVMMVGVVAVTPPAQARDRDDNPTELRKAVTAKGVMNHLGRLQDVADRHSGTRASGTPGYDASVEYVERVLKRAGYKVTKQPFEFPAFRPNGPSVLQRVAPGPVADVANNVMSYSGSGDVTAAASLPVGNPQGCDAADYGPANVGTVVVLVRGGCPFGQKATAAVAARAGAMVVYNNIAEDLNATLGETFTGNLPAVGLSQALGQQLVAQVPGGLRLRVAVSAFRGMARSQNVFAETPWGDPKNVVMTGAHLDSVPAGPGINDNGSGTAALLEVAEQLRKRKITAKNKVRFAFWAAEESGLLGSKHYIANLPRTEQDKIALYLNFDMVGSPNYVRFVYDGDNSAFPPGAGSAAGPAGSGAIEKLFHDYFAKQRLASSETAFSGRSDYGPFIAAGVDIPSGGLFTGAEGTKTAAEAAVYGGTAGVAYDKCYHQACDNIDNVSVRAIDEMSDAVAYAIARFADDTRILNTPVSGPVRGTGPGTPSGGGLHDHEHEVAR
ncbi:MAG TPA: M28 family metallopeptidase [Catenuloplanes sp.]|jgi:Zn-dependent M28 family amino/carboxypeptidase